MSTALQYNLVKNELLVGNDFYVNMNNTKPMISEAAVDFPSPTRATKRKRHKLSRQQQPMPIGSEIRNLSANLVVTPEILKNNVCRVCATYYESGLDLVSLYTGHQGEGPRLAIIMNTMLPIKVRKQDGLSQYACRTCVNQLMAWRKLREGVVEAQKILINQTTQLIRDLNYGMNDSIRTLHFVDLMDSSDDEETASPAAPLPPPPPPPPRPSADSAGYETRFRHYVWTD